MKEDYLWDKTGTDPAVEKLENALSVFRFDEREQQMPARDVKQVEKPRLFTLWSFGFAAAAACVAIAVISWAVSTRFPSSEHVAVPGEAQVISTGANPPVPVEKVSDAPGFRTARVENAGDVRRTPKKRHHVSVAVATKTRPMTLAADDLTEEERYAYNQLVLALSITGDKLNLVREKITRQ